MKEIGETRKIKEYLFHLEGTPIQQAKAISDLTENGMTQKEIGVLMNWSQSQISVRLKLLNLHPKLQERAEKGEIRTSACWELANMPLNEQIKFIDKEKIVLREVEETRRNLALTSEVMQLVNTPLLEEEKKTVKCPKCGYKFTLKNDYCKT